MNTIKAMLFANILTMSFVNEEDIKVTSVDENFDEESHIGVVTDVTRDGFILMGGDDDSTWEIKYDDVRQISSAA